MPGNQAWAGDAPVLVVTLAQRNNSRTGKPNRHSFHDLGLAVGNLSLQATELGLKLHQMGGFDPQAIRSAFGVSEEYMPAAVIAIGYPGATEDLSDDLAGREKQPRRRKPLEEILFINEWKEGSSAHRS